MSTAILMPGPSDREDPEGRAEAVEAAVGIVDREGERVVVTTVPRGQDHRPPRSGPPSPAVSVPVSAALQRPAAEIAGPA